MRTKIGLLKLVYRIWFKPSEEREERGGERKRSREDHLEEEEEEGQGFVGRWRRRKDGSGRERDEERVRIRTERGEKKRREIGGATGVALKQRAKERDKGGCRRTDGQFL